MTNKKWIALICSIVGVLLCVWWYFWYNNYKLRWYNESCDISRASNCFRYIGTKEQIETERVECSEYLKQWYECQWFKDLNDIHWSKWYKDKYQKFYDSYYWLLCGAPEEMCTLERLISGEFCD